MDAITRAQLNRRAVEERRGLPLKWIIGFCVGWLCLGGIFSLWNIILGVGVVFLGIGLTLVIYKLSCVSAEYGYEEVVAGEVQSEGKSRPAGFVALGDSAPKARSGSIKRPAQPAAPPIPRSVPEERPETSFKAFTQNNPRELVCSQRDRLEALCEKTKNEIRVLEPVIRARLHKNRREELEGFLLAQKIVHALGERVHDLDKALEIEVWSEEHLSPLWKLCYGPLELKNDVVSSLHTEEGDTSKVIYDVSVLNCEEKLKSIFRVLRRRQTFFRALEDALRL